MTHGSAWSYSRYGCRCEDCRRAKVDINTRSRNKYNRLTAQHRADSWSFAKEHGLTPFEEAVLIALGHISPRCFTLNEITQVLETAEQFGVEDGLEDVQRAISKQGVSYVCTQAMNKMAVALAEWREDAA